jgi:hypothetical protein
VRSFERRVIKRCHVVLGVSDVEDSPLSVM